MSRLPWSSGAKRKEVCVLGKLVLQHSVLYVMYHKFCREYWVEAANRILYAAARYGITY